MQTTQDTELLAPHAPTFAQARSIFQRKTSTGARVRRAGGRALTEADRITVLIALFRSKGVFTRRIRQLVVGLSVCGNGA